MDEGLEIRHAVRVLLRDEGDRLLLLRTVDPANGEAFWFPAGGGVEEGEDGDTAAVREVEEETGLVGVELGPEVWWRHQVFAWRGRRFDQYERWFLARVEHFEPDGSNRTETEHDDVTACRWWSLDELDATSDRLVPVRLAAHLRELLTKGPPRQPIEVDI